MNRPFFQKQGDVPESDFDIVGRGAGVGAGEGEKMSECDQEQTKKRRP